MKPRPHHFALVSGLAVAVALAVACTGSRATVAPRASGWHKLTAAPVTPEFNARTSVWTGARMLVFGRDQITASDGHGGRYAVGARNVAASYDPAAGTWRRLEPPAQTTGFMGLSAVWTGKEMLVWGQGTRLAYNPSSDEWRRLPSSPLLAVHDGFGTVVWTGRELLGWGGGCCGDSFDDGVAYNPTSNTWRALPKAPLAGNQHPLGAWTGRAFVVISGRRAAAYTPSTNRWRRIAAPSLIRGNATAVWDGREVLIVGGSAASPAYDPAKNRWRALPVLPAGRVGKVAVWTGRRLLLWGGRRGGAAYDPARNAWSMFPRGPLAAKLEPTAVWANGSMIVWGGIPTKTWGEYRAVGAVYTP